MNFDMLFDDDDLYHNFEDVVEINNRIPKCYIRDAKNPFEYYHEEQFRQRYR